MGLGEVEIRHYRAEDAKAFRELNEAWIVKYFEMEEADQKALGNPEGYILNRGGQIFMALARNEAVGTCALLRVKPRVFEVAKMAVHEDRRGLGIGKKLLKYVIARAKADGAELLFLETNRKLAPAIHLYESLGFQHVEPATPSPYARADVYMELAF